MIKKIFKLFKISIFSIITLIVFIFGVILWGGFCFLLAMLGIYDRYKLFDRAALWGRAIFFVANIKVHVVGKSYINKDERYIFMMNHESMLDIPLTLGFTPQYFSMIAKEELFKIPIFGHFIKKMDYIPIKRKNLKKAIEALKQSGRLAKEKNVSIGIYPEGTRTRTGEIGKFKKGGFILALETGFKIIPVSIKGNYELLPPTGPWWFRNDNDVELVFHEPIDVSKYDKNNIRDLMDKVKGVIEEDL